MKKILVATDFSARSDRAIRQASLLARAFDAQLSLVNVVDSDRPTTMLVAERQAAAGQLETIRRTLQDADRLPCEVAVACGSPAHEIAEAAKAAGADLVVVGAHRREILGDTFVGTTAERVIRACTRPVLMVNALPGGPYRRILVAVDLAIDSATALDAVRRCTLDRQAELTILYVFDGPEHDPRIRAYMSAAEAAERLAKLERAAEDELRAFLDVCGIGKAQCLVRPAVESVGATICSVGRAIEADLLVVGTHGRAGLARFMVGSVAERVLRTMECDVLAVGPNGLEKA